MKKTDVVTVAAIVALGALVGACTTDTSLEAFESVTPRVAKRSESSNRGTASADRPVASVSNGINRQPRPKELYYRGTNKFYHSGAQFNRKRIPADQSKRVTLNLAGVDVASASKAVLGDVLKLNYLVDPQATGQITIQTAKPVSHSELLEVFEASLKANGAAIVQSGDLYKVVPADQVLAAQPSVRVGRYRQPGASPGKRIQVVPLRFVAAAEIQNVLQPISPPGSILRIDENRNAIVLTGTDRELDALMDTISVFDVDWMLGRSFALIPVTTSDPEAISQELETVFASHNNGALRGLIQFVPNKRLKSVLVITKNARYLRRAVDWVRRLDAAAQGNERSMYVYHIQNRSAAELARLIRQVFSTRPDTDAAISGAVAPREQPSVQVSPPASRPSAGAGVGARQDRLDVATAPQPVASTGSNLQSIGIVADESNNSLLIVATPQEYRAVLRALRELDIIGKQVLLEATIVEVSLDDELRFGLKWFFSRGNHSITLADTATGVVSSLFPGFSYFFSTASAKTALDALQSVTDINVLSSPSLMVKDNKQAILQIGDQVPVTTRSAVSVGAPDAPIVNTVEFRDTGVILKVTPQVSDGGRVTLDIEQEVSTVVPTTTSGIDSPTIRQRRIQTTVVVHDGESLALGGLIQERSDISKSQIPIIGDIPLLGNAFKQKRNEVRKTELLVMITPRVVRDVREARRVTDEFRRQLNIRIPRIRHRPTIQDNIRRTFD